MSNISTIGKSISTQYGQPPVVVREIEVAVGEMMFYQDMLIKDKRSTECVYEERLGLFNELVESAVSNYIDMFGFEKYLNTYVYICAKHLYQPKNQPFNRPNWHCDGFMSDDISYIWSNTLPTIFNFSEFELTQDHGLSMSEMEMQAAPEHNHHYNDNTLLRLNQYCVHRVADVVEPGMRCFVKLTFSNDKFNLKGNTHNYLIDYGWDARERSAERNVPQSN